MYSSCRIILSWELPQDNFTESQNLLGWTGPLRSLSPTLEQTPSCELDRSARAMSSHFLNTSRGSDFTTSLDSPFPFLTAISMKKFFPNVQPEYPLAQPEAMFTSPVAGFLEEPQYISWSEGPTTGDSTRAGTSPVLSAEGAVGLSDLKTFFSCIDLKFYLCQSYRRQCEVGVFISTGIIWLFLLLNLIFYFFFSLKFLFYFRTATVATELSAWHVEF